MNYSASYSFHGTKTVKFSETDTLKTGVINFVTLADTVYLYLDDNYNQLITLTDQKSIELETGYHKIFVFGKDVPERGYYLQVIQDESLTITLPAFGRTYIDPESSRAAYARLSWDANLIIETDREATIWINGSPVGNGFIKENFPAGTYRIKLEYLNGESYTQPVTIQQHRLRHISHFFLPSERKSKIYGFFPGASQLYKKQYIKGGAAMAFTGLAVGLGFSNRSRFNSSKNEFDQLRFYIGIHLMKPWLSNMAIN